MGANIKCSNILVLTKHTALVYVSVHDGKPAGVCDVFIVRRVQCGNDGRLPGGPGQQFVLDGQQWVNVGHEVVIQVYVVTAER